MRNVLKAIKDNHIEDRVVWGSFNSKVRQAMTDEAPEIARWATPTEVIATYLCYVTGLLPYVNLNYKYFLTVFPTDEYFDMSW